MPDDNAVAELVQQISGYLRDNPLACDTQEGIARWWLAEGTTCDQAFAAISIMTNIPGHAAECPRLPRTVFMFLTASLKAMRVRTRRWLPAYSSRSSGSNRCGSVPPRHRYRAGVRLPHPFAR